MSVDSSAGTDALDPDFNLDPAALLRGDLADLLPDRWAGVDTALAEVLNDQQLLGAAKRARASQVVQGHPQLVSRLRTYTQQEGRWGATPEGRDRQLTSAYAGLPGNPRVSPAIWVCPHDLARPDFARLQRFPDQDMGSCPTHHLQLAPVGS